MDTLKSIFLYEGASWFFMSLHSCVENGSAILAIGDQKNKTNEKENKGI